MELFANSKREPPPAHLERLYQYYGDHTTLPTDSKARRMVHRHFARDRHSSDCRHRIPSDPLGLTPLSPLVTKPALPPINSVPSRFFGRMIANK